MDEVMIVQGSDGRWSIVSLTVVERGYDPTKDPGHYDTKEDAERQVQVLIKEETNYVQRHGYTAQRQSEADVLDAHRTDHIKQIGHPYILFADNEELFDHMVDEHNLLDRINDVH